MRSKILIVLLALLPIMSAAQQKSDRLRPQWVKSLPKASNQTFDYIILSADGYALSDARQNCFSELIAATGLEKGVTTVTDYASSEGEVVLWDNDRKSEYVESSFSMKSIVKGKPVTIYGIKIDEYWERDDDGKIHLKTLYMRSQIDKEPVFDKVKVTSMYGANGLWRSAIVPGWGQLYKGDQLKGGLVLGGTAVLVGGIVATETIRSDYARKINESHNVDERKLFAKRIDQFSTTRNICIGALGALYVYNIVDAIVAPGAKRIVVKKKDGGALKMDYSLTSFNLAF